MSRICTSTIFHCLVSRSVHRGCLLLLLWIILLLYKWFRSSKTICSCIKTNIYFIIGHGEIWKIHFYHIVAETAFFRKLSELVLTFPLNSLHLLVHLFKSEIKFLIQLIKLCVLVCSFMIFLSELIVFLFKNTNPLIKNFDRFFQSMSIWKPVLFLKFFHTFEI